MVFPSYSPPTPLPCSSMLTEKGVFLGSAQPHAFPVCPLDLILSTGRAMYLGVSNCCPKAADKGICGQPGKSHSWKVAVKAVNRLLTKGVGWIEKGPLEVRAEPGYLIAFLLLSQQLHLGLLLIESYPFDIYIVMHIKAIWRGVWSQVQQKVRS